MSSPAASPLRPPFFSFSRPARLLALFTAATGLLWVLQASLLQRILPLDVVEAVVWGSQLQWGQMKSPPLSGWLAYGTFRLFGEADWPLYLLAQAMIVCGVYFVYRLARELFDEYGAATAALLLYFLVYYLPPTLKFCSHYTQFALLPAMTFYFYRAYRDDRLRDWLLLGLVSALALLGKYAAGQVLLADLAVLVATRTGRQRLRSVRPYLGAALCLLLLSPHIGWLFQHRFLSVSHLNHRIEEEISWYQPLETLAIFLYPLVVPGLILLLAALPWKKRAERPDGAGRLALLLPIALIPPGIYLLLSLSGHSIVNQWFSFLAYPAGILVVALVPFRCDRQIFRRLFLALTVYFVLVFAGTVWDVLKKPRYRIHTEPRIIVDAAERFFRTRTGRPVPVGYGERWFAGVVSIYAPHHPPAAAKNDLCDWALVRDRALREGMLLVTASPVELQNFLREQHREQIAFEPFDFKFAAALGKTKSKRIYFGYFPPAETPR